MTESALHIGVLIAALNHDLVKKRSVVTLLWTNESDRRLFLAVPFGCSFDDLPGEAETALRDLAAELRGIPFCRVD